MAQFAVPTSTAFNDVSWGASALSLHEDTDATIATPNDGDYALCLSTAAAGENFIVNVTQLVDPGSDAAHYVRIRALRGAAFAESVDVTLLVGSTEIVTETFALTTSFTDYTITLSSGQAASITNYAALRVKVAKKLGAAVAVRVSEIEVEVPDRVIGGQVQLSNPDSTISTGTGWGASVGQTWECLDETVLLYDDGDYVGCPGTTAAGSAFVVGIADTTDPADHTGHVVRFRAFKAAGAAESVTVALKQGATTIATSVFALTDTATTYELSLTEGEAAAITDYNGLSVSFAKTLGAAVQVRVTVLELETPYPATDSESYYPVVTGVDITVDGTPNSQQATLGLFLPTTDMPALGYEWVLWPSGAGYQQNSAISVITPTSEVVYEALKRGFAVVVCATTYANQPITGLGKFVPPLGATLATFQANDLCYKDVAMAFGKVQKLATEGATHWVKLNPNRGAMGGRSGPGHMSLFNALSPNRDPAVDATWVNQFHSGYSTRPRCCVALQLASWWPFFDQQSVVITPNLFFHASDTNFDGVPAITQLADASANHKEHASALRYGFDFASYPGLGGTGEQNVNARMPVFFFSGSPADGIESQVVTDGFEDGDYHTDNTYPTDVSADAHGMWHPVALYKKLLELSDWHADNSVIALSHSAAYATVKDLLPNVRGVQFFQYTADELSRRVVKFLVKHLRGDPVPHKLVVAVEDVLRGIAQSSGYYFTMGRVFHSNEAVGAQVKLPAARVFVQNSAISDRDRGLNDAIVCKMSLDVVVWMKHGGADAPLMVDQMFADVHRAIYESHQLEDSDGNAQCLTTRVVNYEPLYPQDQSESTCGVVVRVEIDYRMDPRDLTVPV